jgi:hypothetical protein
MIVGVVAVVGVATGTVFAAVSNGMFLSKPDKILLATKNTLEDQSHLMSDLDISGIVNSKSYTIGVAVDSDYGDVEVEYRNNGKKQLAGKADLMYVGEAEMCATLTKDELQLVAPYLDDYVLVYNYMEDNDGYLVDVCDDDVIDFINTSLEKLYNSDTTEELGAAEDVVGVFRSLNFKDASSKNFEINGKNVNCKGYKTTIDEDVAEDILDYCQDYLNNLGLDEYSDEIMEELYHELSYFPDIDTTVYIYKNELAAIIMEAEGEELEILFKGGDYRLQNIEINIEDETLLEITGSTEKSVETGKIKVDGYSISWEYDYKSGDFIIKDSAEKITGNISSQRKSLTVAVDEIDGIELNFYAKKGAEIESQKGETFDLGNADWDDFRDLLDDISDSDLEKLQYLFRYF